MAAYVTRSGVALTVGIIILSLVVLGGLFVVKQQGEQARHSEAVRLAEEKLKSDSNQEVALNGDANKDASKDSTQGSNRESTNSESGSSESTGSGSTNSTSTGSGSAGAESNSSSTAGDSINLSQGGQSTAELPQTGPGGISASLVMTIAVGLVTFAGVSYGQSRRLVSK